MCWNDTDLSITIAQASELELCGLIHDYLWGSAIFVLRDYIKVIPTYHQSVSYLSCHKIYACIQGVTRFNFVINIMF